MKQFSITLLLLLSVVSGWGFFRVEPIVTVEVHEIHVTFTIPEGSHQSMDPELFYLEAEPLEGVTFYPPFILRQQKNSPVSQLLSAPLL